MNCGFLVFFWWYELCFFCAFFCGMNCVFFCLFLWYDLCFFVLFCGMYELCCFLCFILWYDLCFFVLFCGMNCGFFSFFGGMNCVFLLFFVVWIVFSFVLFLWYELWFCLCFFSFLSGMNCVFFLCFFLWYEFFFVLYFVVWIVFFGAFCGMNWCFFVLFFLVWIVFFVLFCGMNCVFFAFFCGMFFLLFFLVWIVFFLMLFLWYDLWLLEIENKLNNIFPSQFQDRTGWKRAWFVFCLCFFFLWYDLCFFLLFCGMNCVFCVLFFLVWIVFSFVHKKISISLEKMKLRPPDSTAFGPAAQQMSHTISFFPTSFSKESLRSEPMPGAGMWQHVIIIWCVLRASTTIVEGTPL